MESSGGPRVAFVVVTKGLDYPTAEERRPSGARYTRDAIRGMLQFMGCKPRHAYKATQLVFQKLERFAAEGSKFSYGSRQLWGVGTHDEGSVYIAMPRSEFYELVCSTLTEYNYKYAPSSDEIKAACSLKERRRHVIVLLCGTSGSGKSTLASILANRLGISTVLSTDSVRHMMRSFTTAEETPLLFASTYEAGEALRKQQALDTTGRGQQQQQQQQIIMLQQANAPLQHQLQRQQPDILSVSAGESEGGQRWGPARGVPTPISDSSASVGVPVPHRPTGHSPALSPSAQPPPSAHDQAIRGYKAQCELVSEHLEQLISSFEARRQSLVVEGVHLHVGLVMRLLQRHPGIVPFLVYIKNEGKHVERMAVRAKYMTLDPNKNKYVKNMRNIRWIQDYLYRKAEKHAIPCVENTNIDRSVGLIHLTLLGCLKRMMKGEQVLDAGSSTVRMLHTEYTAVMESMVAATGGASGTAGTAVSAASGTVANTSGGGLSGGGSTSSMPPRVPSESANSGPLPQPLLPPPPRVLGSPRVFHNREVPPSSSALRGTSGDGYGSTGGGSSDVAGHPGGDALASAAAGNCRSSHNNYLPHSGNGIGADLPIIPVPRASSLSGNTLLLSSSPKCPAILSQHPQHYGTSRQSQTGRRDSNTNNTQEVYPAPPLPLSEWPASSPVQIVSGSPQHGGNGVVGSGGTYGSVPAALVLLSAAAAAADAPGSLDPGPSPRGQESRRDPVLAAPFPSTSSRAASIPLPAFPEARTASLPLPAFPNAAVAIRASSNPQTLQPLLQSSVLGQDSLAILMGLSRRREDSQPQLHLDGIASSAPGPASALVPKWSPAAGKSLASAPPPAQQPQGILGRSPSSQEYRPPQGQAACMQSAHGEGLMLAPHQQEGHSGDGASGRPALQSCALPLPGASRALVSCAATKGVDVLVCGRVTSPSCPGRSGGGGLCRADSGSALLAAPESPVYAAPSNGHARDDRSIGAAGGCGAKVGRDMGGRGLPENGGEETSDGSARLPQVHVVCAGAPGSAARGGTGEEQQKSCRDICSPSLHAQEQRHGDNSQQQQRHNNQRNSLHSSSTVALRADDLENIVGGITARVPPDGHSTQEPSLPELYPPACAVSERMPVSGVVEVWDGGQHGTTTDASQPAMVRRSTSSAGSDECPVRTAAAAAAAVATAGAADADAVHDAQEAALAAAQDALSRFGDTCPDEVLQVIMQSAIFEQQMDTVTERSVRPARFSQPPSPPPHLPAILHPMVLSSPEPLSQTPHVQATILCYKQQSKPGSAVSTSSACGRESAVCPSDGGSQCEATDATAPCPLAAGEPKAALMTWNANGIGKLATDGAKESGPPGVYAGDLLLTTGSPSQAEAQPSGVPVAAIPGGSVFAGAHMWAATAVMGGHSRGLGGSSSSSHSGFSSDDDVGGSEAAGGSAAGAASGAATTRRHKGEMSLDRPMGRGGLADSDDPDGEGYTGYSYGGASPLQEYGSVYESATHDDMDEHGDEDETAPLGRSNTLIRHLAGVLERNRMRASASASVAAHAGARPAVPLPPQANRQHHGPSPTASSGNGARLGNMRRTPGAIAERLVGSTGHAANGGVGRSGSKSGESYEGAGCEGTGLNVQLRQMLQGGGSMCVSRSAVTGGTTQHRGLGAAKGPPLAGAVRNALREPASDAGLGMPQSIIGEVVGDAEGNSEKHNELGPVEIRECSAVMSAGVRLNTPFAGESGMPL